MNPMLSSSFKEYTNWKLKVRIDSMELGGDNSYHKNNNNSNNNNNNNINNNNNSKIGGNDGGGELDRFLYDVDAIKEDMKTMEKLKQRLQEYTEDSRSIRVTTTMKELRSIMDSEMDHVLILAKAIMKRLETLGRYGSGSSNSNSSFAVEKKGGMSSASSSSAAPTSSLEKTRMSVVSGVGKKLREIMDEYQGLRAKMAATYKETIEYRFLTVTGDKKYIEEIEKLITTGEIEVLIREAMEEDMDEDGGKRKVDDVVEEIQQRLEGAKQMQKQLIDLHQLLLDMVSVVETQSQRIIQEQQQQQMQLNRGGNSFLMRPGAAQLQDSNWDRDKEAKKRGTIALILIVAFIVVLTFPLFQFESDSGRE